MTPYIELELRKLRLITAGLAGFFLLSLPVVSYGLADKNHTPLDILNAALMFWAVVGIPLYAVMVGAASGLGLRSEPAASAEDPLPLSPERRSASALAAVALTVLALLALFALTASLTSPPWSTMPLNLTAALFTGPFVVFYMSAAGFTASFALRQGVLGGLVGVLLAGATGGFLTMGWNIHELHPRVPFLASALLIMVAAITGTLWALRSLSPWAFRGTRPGLLRWGLLILSLLAGPTAALAGWNLARSQHVRMTDLLAWGVSGEAPHGVLVYNREDGTIFLDKDGKRTVVLPSPGVTLGETLVGFTWYSTPKFVWDADGSLWAIHDDHYSGGGPFEEDGSATAPATGAEITIWHGKPDGPLPRVAVFRYPEGLSLIRTAAGVSLMRSEKDHYFLAAVPAAGKKPVWRSIGTDYSSFDANEEQELSRHWGWSRPYKDNRLELYFQRPDGRREYIDLSGCKDVLLQLPPRTDMKPGYTLRPQVVHESKGAIWLDVHRRWLVKVVDGDMVERFEAPADWKGGTPRLRYTKAGVFSHTGRSVYFMSWDGGGFKKID